MPGKRQVGWPSLLVTFLLATQEKSDSAAGGGRKPAAGEHINEVIGLSHRHTAPPHQATTIRNPASTQTLTSILIPDGERRHGR